MSIMQGGPGFPALHQAMYNYMVTGCQLVTLPVCDIPDAGVQALIDQVKFSALCKINNIRNCIVLFKLVPIMSLFRVLLYSL